MDISDFLRPSHVSFQIQKQRSLFTSHILSFHALEQVNYSDFDVFLLGNLENKNLCDGAFVEAADRIREQCNRLTNVSKKISVLDLGNVHPGSSLSDSAFALQEVLTFLLQFHKPIICIGGSQDMLVEMCNPIYSTCTFPVISIIDSKIDYSSQKQKKVDNTTFISSLAESFRDIRINHLAHQTYFTTEESIDWFEQNYYPHKRLAELKNIEIAEPLLRESQVINIDLKSVRFSDNPGVCECAPTGLTSEQICQLAWYSGFSEENQVFVLSEYAPYNDVKEVSALLSAQLLWHYIDGVSQRKQESPLSEGVCNKYFVKNNYIHQSIVFYESKKTKRMWVEVPCNDKITRIMPCTALEYERATKHDLPEEWLLEFNRLFQKR